MHQNNQSKFMVTKDINANSNILRELERDGYIVLSQTKIETPDVKIKNNHFPNGVVNYTKIGKCLVASKADEKRFDILKGIIGINNMADVIHVDTHLREGNDYFVTEDHDILNVRDELSRHFPELKIRTPKELNKELRNER